MSARGRHRRPRTQRIARATLALTAGGAGIALPLMGAGNANAASVDTWEKVAQCESTGDWSINTGNGYYGGLQFSQSTWESFGGTEYAATADQATKEQQIAIAEKVLAEQGPGAWPNCGPKAGLSQNSGDPDIDPSGQGGQAQAKPEAKAEPKAEPKSQPKAEAPAAGADKRDDAPAADRSKRDAKPTDYTVKSGDTLFKIAKSQGVAGGWERVYEGNREVIGDDPDLIYPDQRLSLDGSGATKSHASRSEARPEAPAPQPKQESKPAPKPESNGGEKAADSADSNKGGFQKPVDAPASTPYGASGGSWSSGSHTGVDFSASSGTPVKAVTSGTVVSAGWGGAYGNEVVVKHSDGRYSQYGHLSSLSVSAGQTVGAGDQLGLSGSTGNSTGPHLHFEIRTGPDYGSDIDPLAYLRANGVSV
ncbi:LysM peptidoglycan-binding domain-containing protein [Streptomyces armeniacus]|uniref:LysM peptidoglycan-binding domain-containing protein n=1 Tax=Streptomyces armeniacus TaxID=83291 RepID=A0A345XSB6_9ACTN|nr:transglycosylase family protein [Streptomyces armeniacus]AXK34532.1 LysM peptidoglycan-binding domain-containing protein [Streptomyces armeniacus]